MRILFSLQAGVEARPTACRPVESGVEALVETIEQRALAWREACVAGDGLKASGGQGSVDALEEL
jgi:hypothetical protein